MYYIETSLGDVHFSFDGDIKTCKGGDRSELKMSKEDRDKLNRLYKLCRGFSFQRYENKVFIVFDLSDGFYGCPEYVVHTVQ